MRANDLMKMFSRNVRFICKQRGLNISYLEKQIGVATGYFSRLEKNGLKISLLNAYNASEILGVTIDDLLNKDISIEQRIAELKEELETLEKQRKTR